MMTSDVETDEDDGPTEISKDDLFHILQNKRRRQVLQYIVTREGPFEMRAVAEQVAAWEHDTTVRELSSDQRQRVYIALYQSHLSKLDEVGLIRYQQNRGIIEATELIDVVKPHIEGTDSSVPAEDADATAQEPEFLTRESEGGRGDGETYYVGATLLSLGLTAGVWSNVIPASILGSLGLTLLVIAIFSLTGLVHRWQRRDATAE